MVEVAQSIDLELPKKLHDPEYRKRFFLAEASARIAAQLIALRKRRNLNQRELAKLISTQQPAISRIERADYQNWSFSTLRKIAEVLDARIRIYIEPAEDVIQEYEAERLIELSTTGSKPAEASSAIETLQAAPIPPIAASSRTTVESQPS